MKPALLIETKRNNISEKQHFGFIIVVDKKENIISKIGDDKNKNFWFRSAAKPLQASLIIKSGAFDKFGFTLEELAVCCASHTGTEQHTETVLSVLNKINLSEEKLQCGIHAPIDKETCENLIRNNITATQLHNNCSGKHAGMLAVCIANGWDIQNYLDFEHSLQKEITKIIATFCNFDEKNINIGIDGCSAPVHALPLSKMGTGYINLFSDPNYENLKNAVSKNPVLIGGNGRLDTEIIKASSGKLISKVGAEGLCITINTESEQTLIVKILDSDYKARSVATINALKQLNWLSEEDIEKNEIKKLYNFEIKNWKKQIVGKINTCFKI